MQIKTFINAVALALLAAGAHMKIPSSTYTILNQIPSSQGAPGAITFNGKGQTVTASSGIPPDSKQVYSPSINHPVYLFLTHPFLTHPLEVDCERL